jgi:hypothetical protein
MKFTFKSFKGEKESEGTLWELFMWRDCVSDRR